MDATIVTILGLDGITNGAIYALVALALVLVFAVTRVVFIPQGEFVAFGALTMALMQTGKLPGTVWLLLSMAVLASVMDVVQTVRERWAPQRLLRELARHLLLPLAAVALTWAVMPMKPGLLVQALLSLALVTPMGPLVYRVAYR